MPTGATGELLTRGPYTPRGYYRAPQHNQRAFTPDGWYRTGDLVRWHPSGNLVVEGRLKDLVNRGGEKVSIDEVEDLVRAVPGVGDAAALALPDPALGERVGVCVIPGEGPRPTLETIHSFFAARGVAAFKWPELLHLVEEFPLTPVGKVDRRALRERVLVLTRVSVPVQPSAATGRPAPAPGPDEARGPRTSVHGPRISRPHASQRKEQAMPHISGGRCAARHRNAAPQGRRPSRARHLETRGDPALLPRRARPAPGPRHHRDGLGHRGLPRLRALLLRPRQG